MSVTFVRADKLCTILVCAFSASGANAFATVWRLVSLALVQANVLGASTVGTLSALVTNVLTSMWWSVTIAFICTNLFSTICVRAFTTNYTRTWAVVVNNLSTCALVYANGFCTRFVGAFSTISTLVLTAVWCCVTRTLVWASAFRTGCIQTLSALSTNTLTSMCRRMSLTLPNTLGFVAVHVCAFATSFALVLAHVRFGLYAPSKHNHCDAQHS